MPQAPQQVGEERRVHVGPGQDHAHLLEGHAARGLAQQPPHDRRRPPRASPGAVTSSTDPSRTGAARRRLEEGLAQAQQALPAGAPDASGAKSVSARARAGKRAASRPRPANEPRVRPGAGAGEPLDGHRLARAWSGIAARPAPGRARPSRGRGLPRATSPGRRWPAAARSTVGGSAKCPSTLSRKRRRSSASARSRSRDPPGRGRHPPRGRGGARARFPRDAGPRGSGRARAPWERAAGSSGRGRPWGPSRSRAARSAA